MEPLWLVNGQTTGLDPADRGLAYGDGLFETMAAANGRIRWLDYHLQRLEHGCRRLSIPPLDSQEIRREIINHCPRDGRCVVKLIVTRGSGARGYPPPVSAQPTRILSISSWPDYPSANYTDGIELRTLQLRLGENPALAGLKHLCRLEQVLAQLELRGSDAEEGLLLDSSGYVVGGIASNLFAIRGSELATPKLTRCGVRGVMRRVVLESATQLELAVAERDLTIAAVQQADEIFVTNSLFGIWPVAQLDQHTFTRGDKTRQLMQLLGYGPDA
ncbi:MAG TPA: aminodeoxychorismate lyase [Gammaproteobacteria bacterium]|nr:aminodeoxychorismate lyase [Gammaproteobacteria bacterium]